MKRSKQTIRINESKLRNIIKESIRKMLNEAVSEKAVSKAQQRFFGMVDAYKKGDMPDASPAIKKAAKGMTKKEVKDFAKTKHKGLPDHVNETTFQDLNDMDNYSGQYGMGDRFDIYIDGQLEYHDIPEDAVDRICASWERKPYDVDIDVKRINESMQEKAVSKSQHGLSNHVSINEAQLKNAIRKAINELSVDTERGFLDKTYDLGRSFQRSNGLNNIVDKYNKLYAFKVDFQNGGFAEAWLGKSLNVMFKCGENRESTPRTYQLHYTTEKVLKVLTANGSNVISDGWTLVSYFADNLKAAQRAKLRRLLELSWKLHCEPRKK